MHALESDQLERIAQEGMPSGLLLLSGSWLNRRKSPARPNRYLLPCCALRTGSLVWRGAVGSAAVLNSGTGSVYISGVTDSVDVNLSGLGNVVVDAASGAAGAAACNAACNVQLLPACLVSVEMPALEVAGAFCSTWWS